MDAAALKDWRKRERERLIAQRVALSQEALKELRIAIDAHLETALRHWKGGIAAFCWPYQGEYDARFLMHGLRGRGVSTALPVVVAPRQALIFRLWRPGDALTAGVYGIPYPASGDAVTPDIALVPMNGFDAGGYRLGYGGGFFDRTLAALRAAGSKPPLVIGIAHEQARMVTIHPQSHDIPMDYVVTERGSYQRTAQGLVFPAEWASLNAPPSTADRAGSQNDPR